ncbi:class III extradiol dioxygenase subunit B-like domain-containing protein [Streptomyces paludis]|uniref:Uncharacterized protein n=1 Tax=Streptomyces paludis TaxID=2282738 RepID=A0A345HVD4_9ACTN|nr:class III extradiol dioxygenase subunit B-like domain-containing protein [Streptomyces paludis]AXG80658.1 hypothetical protein DVK44_26620 [Streptomyces paludis]
MLVSAAVCPCPPLLVPEVAAGAAPELDAARAACAEALGVLAAARPDRLVVVGTADGPGREAYPEGATGSFRGFGVAAEVVLGARAESGATGPATDPERGATGGLPVSLAVGAWLLEQVCWAAAPVSGLGVGETSGTQECVTAGREIAAVSDRVALLVMGDASACRTVKAPGYLDERAAGFDTEAARLLAAADVPGLLALDAGLARELRAAGRAPWQVLAGAAGGAGLAGELLYEDAPYGVGYLVAVWS